MTTPKENPLQNKTLKTIDSLFGFIFKIGEVLFDYVTILFEVIGQIGNIGINVFFKYIFGFFASIFKLFEKLLSKIFSFFLLLLKPFNGLFKFLYNFANDVYNMFFEILKQIIIQFDNITQYIIGFFIFLVCTVYYFVYKKDEKEDTNARNNENATNFLEFLKFSSVFGFIYNIIKGGFSKIFNMIKTIIRLFAIIFYSIFVGITSIGINMAFFKKIKTDIDTYINEKILDHPFIRFIGYILFYIPCMLSIVLYRFITSTWNMFYEKISHFNDPIMENKNGDENGATKLISDFFKKIAPIIEFIKNIYNQIRSHFNIWDLSRFSFAYVIISSFIYILFLYKLYFWGSDDLTKIAGDNHLYYYFIMTYLLFIGPIVYILLKLPQQSFTGLIILAFSSISLLLMYVSNYYINYNKSVGMDETPEQESDRNTYNMLFVIYSAIVVFFVNFKILKPNFDQSTILWYTLFNLFFIVALIGYSVSYKIKLTNRLNKKAQKYEIPSSNNIKNVFIPETTSYVK